MAGRSLPAVLRDRRLATLRELLREWNGDAEFAAALKATLNRKALR